MEQSKKRPRQRRGRKNKNKREASPSKSGSKRERDGENASFAPSAASPGPKRRRKRNRNDPNLGGLSSTRSEKSPLQQAMQKRLQGSKFRLLNEMLYTTRGEESLAYFQENQELFELYHEGFREQVEKWPANPLDVIVRDIRRNHKASDVVADLGCGDAELSRRVENEVHSFDLVSRNDRVIACDIANVPLEDKSVDVVVFCLALMGTNVADFIREANRLLRASGKLKIAEVRSRFETADAVGGRQENSEMVDDLFSSFQDLLGRCGFVVQSVDKANKMFFVLDAVKVSDEVDDAVEFCARPCVYKRR